MTRPRIELTTKDSSDVDPADRLELQRLWTAAFGGRFGESDAEHALGGVHVIARIGKEIIGHASALPRRVRVGDAWHEIGYVEAVGTHPAHQGLGVGTAVMRHLHQEIDERWPFAMLSTGRATDFYRKLGWTRWLGTSYTRLADGTEVLDGEHGGLMVRHPTSAEDCPGRRRVRRRSGSTT